MLNYNSQYFTNPLIFESFVNTGNIIQLFVNKSLDVLIYCQMINNSLLNSKTPKNYVK